MTNARANRVTYAVVRGRYINNPSQVGTLNGDIYAAQRVNGWCAITLIIVRYLKGGVIDERRAAEKM